MLNGQKKYDKMIITKIFLKNYRNYDNLEIVLNSKLNIIIGNNAQGKTNILESIYTLAITKSFLPVNDKNLIKYNEQYLIIKGDIIKENINKKLELLINENVKKVKINGKEINKFSEYISKLNIILFSPDNIRMVKEGPSARRKYLNIELSQLYNNYIQLINSFNLILRQRNEFLKIMANKDNYDEVYLEVLNKKYVELAVDIYLYRYNFINDINLNISKIYKNLTNDKELTLKYISNIEYNEDKKEMQKKLLVKLNKNFIKEKMYKMTLIGPHRDDFHFYLNEKNISLYGSQGQLRLAVLSLKFSEIDIFKKILKDNPVLLLDDIFSELDLNKRNKLIKYLDDNIQTIITTTDINLIDKNIVKKSNIYKVKNGKIISTKTRRE